MYYDRLTRIENGIRALFCKLSTFVTINNLEEILDIRRNSGIYSFESDGVGTVYTFPHNLTIFPSFVGVTRGLSTDFEVFNTTWDATTVTITYQNPPLAGEINLNWVAIS